MMKIVDPFAAEKIKDTTWDYLLIIPGPRYLPNRAILSGVKFFTGILKHRTGSVNEGTYVVLEMELVVLFRDHPRIEVFGFTQFFLFFHAWLSLEITRGLFFLAVTNTFRLTLFDHTPAKTPFSILSRHLSAPLLANLGRGEGLVRIKAGSF
jgi:hypothetical protein